MHLHRLFFIIYSIALPISTKNVDDHDENAPTVLDSKEVTPNCGSYILGLAPPIHIVKARCPDPQIMQQQFPFKEHPFSPKFMDCENLKNWTHRKEKWGHC